MPSPLVYLIPEKFIGPVFVFFGQTDGIETQTDQLGNAVWVPENGVIKLKGNVDSLISKPNGRTPNIYWVQVAKDGSRKIMKIHGNTYKDENGNWADYYYDEAGKPHHFIQTKENPEFYYFSEKEKNETMIFGHESCRHQEFTSNNEPSAKPPTCGKFLVISPKEYLRMPRWLWQDTRRSYSSIQEFTEEANERLKIKRHYYKLQ